MANDSDIDVLYTLINQSPDGYLEFYPKKEGEIALSKWPFLAGISISGTNRPTQPIQLQTPVNIFTKPAINSIESLENEEPSSNPISNQVSTEIEVEPSKALTNQIQENVFSIPVTLGQTNVEKVSSIPTFLQTNTISNDAQEKSNLPKVLQFGVESNLVVESQSSQIASLFKRLEKN
ncbi:hypothetical protein [Polynucleobacter rarus]|jgi:hypothetical protein|uniref:hypothetical protein n=1 Tax=Polynucleobacter rarus TaxID=556055 RepID=UPI000D3E84CE|nr:hypothetical protein [Polynucleobacter rarus]